MPSLAITRRVPLDCGLIFYRAECERCGAVVDAVSSDEAERWLRTIHREHGRHAGRFGRLRHVADWLFPRVIPGRHLDPESWREQAMWGWSK